MPLDYEDSDLINKLSDFSTKYNLKFLNEAIFSQKFFGIESNYIEKNSNRVELFEGQLFDNTKYVKAFTNDKAGKSGRTKWFLIPAEDIPIDKKQYISEWQVIVSSANAGGQKRSSQMEIIDNCSVFGRSRLALRSFQTKAEAQNFIKYCRSSIIKFAFLLTDENLTSLAKWVPDLGDYSDKNSLIDFSQDIDEQMFKILNLSSEERDYVLERSQDYQE